MNEEEMKNAPKMEIDLGNEKTFYIADDGAYFCIAFDKLFGMPQLAIYNPFEMNSKRNFKNLCSQLLETYQELFLDENESLREEAELFFFQLLNIKSEIIVSEVTPYNKFEEYMENLIEGGDGNLKHIIDTFVENNYTLELDKLTKETKEKKRKVNSELQFTDAHAKELLKISYLYRVLIPIISVFFTYNKSNFSKTAPTGIESTNEEDGIDIEFEEANTKIFAYLFDKFASNPEALRNKIYRLAYSGVSKTAYSDKRFWAAAKNIGITEKTEALEIYKKLLVNAIPKLSIEKNIISFLQSVINNQVDFLFQNKFKYRFIPLDSSETNYSTEENEDSAMSEFERMEIQQSRKDEGAYVIRKENIKEVIDSIAETFGVGISDSEIKEGMKTIKRSQIQEEIIALLTFKYFSDKNSLKFVSFYQYCYLLLVCQKYLLQQKYIYIPKILTANCEKHRERLNISGKKVKPEILNSKKYKELLEEKYGEFATEVEKPFLSLIATIYSSIFTDNEGNELFDSSVKVGKIAEEILDLLKLV